MYTLPELPYDFADLEPAISSEIMQLHYNKHHQGYVNNLNTALEKYRDAENRHNVEEMIALQQAIRFHGGGHVNHSVFWTNLAPTARGGGGPPAGALAMAIEHNIGPFHVFKERMSAAANGIQGSGWAWLGYCKAEKHLKIVACANQDPLSIYGLTPLLGIDVWEHAYYLQYKNVRAEYVKNIWSIVNWQNVHERYAACRQEPVKQ